MTTTFRYLMRRCVKKIPKLQYKRMRQGEWPPPNSSPLHPVFNLILIKTQIEPWGKQFFVFNTLQDGKPETLLCVTDHSRKPLMYLYREDFQKLYMSNIKNELNRLENISREDDTRYEEMLLNNLNKSYAMQRMKTGRHSSHTIMRSTHRIKK